MKQEKQDRRSLRTRHLVSAAMLELMRGKRYDAITVQDLLDRSGIGRSTLYAHFFDKEDVLKSVSEQMLETFRHQLSLRNVEQKIVPSLELFQHAQENYQFFQAMVRGHGAGVVWETVLALLSRNIERTLATTFAEKSSPSVPPTVVSQYLAGAFLSLLRWLCLECGQSTWERANRQAEQAGGVDKESSNTALRDRWTPSAVQNTGKWSSQSRCTITGGGVRPWLSAPPQTSNEQPNYRYLDECFAGLHLALVILA